MTWGKPGQGVKWHELRPGENRSWACGEREWVERTMRPPAIDDQCSKCRATRQTWFGNFEPKEEAPDVQPDDLLSEVKRLAYDAVNKAVEELSEEEGGRLSRIPSRDAFAESRRHHVAARATADAADKLRQRADILKEAELRSTAGLRESSGSLGL